MSNRVASFIRRRTPPAARPVVAGTAILGLPAIAFADPLEMDPIVFPIDPSSIIGVVAVAGGSILLLTISIWVAFTLIKRMPRRAVQAI